MKTTFKNYFRLLIEGKRKEWELWLWKPVLCVASLLFRCVVSIRKRLYQAGIFHVHKLPLPVVSVGNVTWGGVGKTPLVRYISQFYLNEKKVPMILTRGYGSDESREFQQQGPGVLVGIGKNRKQAAYRILQSQKSDVAILDDGFQHWKLDRNLDIVVINVLNPFGNNRLIPYGILRETKESLKRADMIVFNDVNLVHRKALDLLYDQTKLLAPKAILIEAQREPLYFYWAKSKSRMDLNRLRGKLVTTFSGVGAPRSFQLLLTQLGLKTIRNFEFCDHHPFSKREIEEILEVKGSSHSEYVVTTEKDLLRKEKMIMELLDPLVLKIALRITSGESILQDRLRQVLVQGARV